METSSSLPYSQRPTRLSLLSHKWIQPTSSHLRLGFLSELFHSCFSTKIFLVPLLPHKFNMPPPISSPWCDQRNSAWWEVQIMKLLLTRFSPFSCTSSFLVSIPSLPPYSSKTLCLSVLPSVWETVFNIARPFRTGQWGATQDRGQLLTAQTRYFHW